MTALHKHNTDVWISLPTIKTCGCQWNCKPFLQQPRVCVHTVYNSSWEALKSRQLRWNQDKRWKRFELLHVQRLTLRCDSKYSVWSCGPVDIRRVSDCARIGAIVIQRGIDQSDGGIPTRRAPLPLDATAELTLCCWVCSWVEVEKLKEKKTSFLFIHV